MLIVFNASSRPQVVAIRADVENPVTIEPGDGRVLNCPILWRSPSSASLTVRCFSSPYALIANI